MHPADRQDTPARGREAEPGPPVAPAAHRDSDAVGDSVAFASAIRSRAIRMVSRARASHLGGALSMADILAVLYGGVLSVRPSEPNWAERDRFILSKGHSCTALYAALARRGFFPETELDTYGRDGSRLMAHASHHVPGVEFSAGSLGHGLSFGAGKAMAARRAGHAWRVFVLLSDGELNEGSNWETILFAPHHRLENLVVIVDYNKVQSLGDVAAVLDLAPLAAKFESFGWAVREVDGHDHTALRAALMHLPWSSGRPSCLIAHTIKGKGVDFMEGKLAWHYRSPNPEEERDAQRQVGQTPDGS